MSICKEAEALAASIRDRQSQGVVPFIPCDTDTVLRLLDHLARAEHALGITLVDYTWGGDEGEGMQDFINLFLSYLTPPEPRTLADAEADVERARKALEDANEDQKKRGAK